jgi:hypothetical protein
MVVHPDTDNGEEARDFIISACSDEEQMSEFAKNKPEYVNNTVVMDSLISANTVFNPEISGNFKNGQNYFAELSETAKNIDFNGLITEHDATVKADFQKAIKEQYLEGGKTYDEAIDEFKNLVAEHITTIDVD